MKDFDILYEDSDILALSKPAGISVHHDGKTEETVVTDWLVSKYPDIEDVGEPFALSSGEEVPRPGIVHRLDKETSGVLLVAKTHAGFNCLKGQFADREIKKTYNAFVYGTIRDERGIVDKPIGRATGSIRKWATPPRVRGELRDAITRYKAVLRGQGATFVEIWPLTGRTHQIRVHMSSIGHAVVSDSLYAPTREKILGFNRTALHASKVVFKDLERKEREVVAPFPEDFEEALRKIKG